MAGHKEYPAVDVFKMICAILVILIHTKPFANNFWLDAGIGMMTRFAVPYFFSISGFFFFRKLTGSIEHYWKNCGMYLLRLLRFYIIWFILLRIVDVLVGGATIKPIGYYIKQFFFTTDGSALWFVAALMWAVIIVAVLGRWMKPQTVFAIGIMFLLIGYTFSTLLGVTGDWPVIQRLQPIVGYTGVQGGLYFAFPYVAMGALMAGKPLKASIKKDALCAGLFFVCLGVESIVMVMKLHAPLTFLWLSAVPMTWFVTRLTLTVPLKSKPGYYVIRKISTLCYVLHVAVLKTLEYAFDLTGFAPKDPANLALTALTLLVTLFMAYGIFLLSKKKAFSWAKYLM